MVKGFNEAWHNSGRKESEISIRYQYNYGVPLRGMVSIVLEEDTSIPSFGAAELHSFISFAFSCNREK